MQTQPAFWPDPLSHLRRTMPDDPVFYHSPQALQARARFFLDRFPGLVTYAVKANDRAEVLDNLVAAGIDSFDVASPAEMAAVRRVKPDAVLHYHNPIRTPSEIAEGRAQGVASWSVDCMAELEKLGDLPEGSEIAVRLKLAVKGGAYDFGSKFGATPDEAEALLREVARRGWLPSVTFHPGTQCEAAEAWAAYIGAAAEVAERAGVRLHRLNVGGGFPGRRGAEAPDLGAIVDRIAAETRKAFGEDAPALVCEPGRGMVADSFYLALRVRAVRNGAVFLNDGIYGNLTELRDLGPMSGIRAVSPEGHSPHAAPEARIVFGPTCDSLDRLPEPLPLPGDLAEGDYLLFPSMGAYSQVLATQFNGYGAAQVVTVQDLSGAALDTGG